MQPLTVRSVMVRVMLRVATFRTITRCGSRDGGALTVLFEYHPISRFSGIALASQLGIIMCCRTATLYFTYPVLTPMNCRSVPASTLSRWMMTTSIRAAVVPTGTLCRIPRERLSNDSGTLRLGVFGPGRVPVPTTVATSLEFVMEM